MEEKTKNICSTTSKKCPVAKIIILVILIIIAMCLAFITKNKQVKPVPNDQIQTQVDERAVTGTITVEVKPAKGVQ